MKDLSKEREIFKRYFNLALVLNEFIVFTCIMLNLLLFLWNYLQAWFTSVPVVMPFSQLVFAVCMTVAVALLQVLKFIVSNDKFVIVSSDFFEGPYFRCVATGMICIAFGYFHLLGAALAILVIALYNGFWVIKEGFRSLQNSI